MDLSIIIPIYQVEAYLSECLDSIIRQKGTVSIQAILVDDGSLDGSTEIALAYKKQYPDLFEYYRKENGGLSDARNYGIAYVKGTYLMFLDSDDYLADDACALITDVFHKTKADLLFFNFIPFDEGGRKIHKVKEGGSRFVSDKEYLLCPPSAWNKVIKSELYRNSDIRFPKGIWYEDLATTGAYVNFAQKIYYLDENLYYYRQRKHSIMNQDNYNKKMLDIRTAMELIMNRSDLHLYHDELEYVCISNLIYQSAERLLSYQRYIEIEQLTSFANQCFVHWESNPYLKRRSRLYRTTCRMIKRKHYRMAKLLYYLKNKMV